MAVLAVFFAMSANCLFAKYLPGIPSWLVSAPSLAGCFGFLYALMERNAWNWPVVRRLGLSTVPNVSGRYEGTLISEEHGDFHIHLRIDQTWSRLLIRLTLTSNTSSSESVAAAISRRGLDDAQIIYTFENRPHPGIADPDMADHTGTAILNYSDGRLSGRYFNARGRTGYINLSRAGKNY